MRKCPDCGAPLDEHESFWDCTACGYFKLKHHKGKKE